jgi:uncharacterized DUF497 family protein
MNAVAGTGVRREETQACVAKCWRNSCVLRRFSNEPVAETFAGVPAQARSGILFIPDGLRVRPAKSAANLKKHGIDFVGAQVLWSDPDRLEIPARSLDEPRAQVIGRIGEVVWSAFITMRNNRIRIISVRRARDEEQAAYLQG